MSKKQKPSFEAEISEGWQEAGRVLEKNDSKKIILLIMSFIFPVGGLMLAWQLYPNKSTAKLAKAYLVIAILSIAMGAIMHVLRLMTRDVLWPFFF